MDKNNPVSKELVILVLILFVGVGIIPSTGYIVVEKQHSPNDELSLTYFDPMNVIIVPIQYPTIQKAIDNASDGDTIYVLSGIYYENVVVNKEIYLIGEDKNSTIIDGNKSKDVIYVSTDKNNISGFTIRNSGSIEQPTYDAGIDIRSKYNNIQGNNILDNLYGLHIGSNSNYNTISNNNIQNNFGGIILRYCNNSTIFENKITNNIRGIHLEFSNSSNIMTNNVRSNHHYGIGLCSSSKNNILGNNISLSDNHGVYQHHSCSNTFSSNNIGSNNDYGVCLYHLSDNNLFYHNNFINNNRSAYDGCTNIWNNGYPYGGNYWSDYVGYDNYYGPNQNISGADNIGDTPYPIHGGSNNDNYPLMKPWGFLLEGYCYYEDMNPADKITVRITNMDSGRKWHAGTINNYYSFVFAPGEDINASETLQIIAKDSAHYKGVVNHKFKEIESVNTINITIDLVPGDVDFDGDVDLSDLAQLLAYYGITTGATYEQGDVDGDGDVDLADLAALLANYGTGI